MKAIVLLILLLVIIGILISQCSNFATTQTGHTSVVCTPLTSGGRRTTSIETPLPTQTNLNPLDYLNPQHWALLKNGNRAVTYNDNISMIEFAIKVSNSIYCVHHYDYNHKLDKNPNAVIASEPDSGWKHMPDDIKINDLISPVNIWFSPPVVPHVMLINDFLIFLIQSKTPDSLRIKDMPKEHGNNDTHAGLSVVGYNKEFKRIVIAFRGTKNEIYEERSVAISNWFDENTEYRQENFHGVGVHAGFKAMYDVAMQKIKKEIEKLLRTHSSDNPGILVTGHSSGGGVATLASFDLALSYKNRQVMLVTFGSPRVGSPQFVQSIGSLKNHAHFRIVNKSDFMTAAPLRQMPKIEILEYNTRMFMQQVMLICSLNGPYAQTCFDRKFDDFFQKNIKNGKNLEHWEYLHLPQEIWYDRGGKHPPRLDLRDTFQDEDPNGRSSMNDRDSAALLKHLPDKLEDHINYLGFEMGAGEEHCQYSVYNDKLTPEQNYKVNPNVCNQHCSWYPFMGYSCQNPELTQECNRNHTPWYEDDAPMGGVY